MHVTIIFWQGGRCQVAVFAMLLVHKNVTP